MPKGDIMKKRVLAVIGVLLLAGCGSAAEPQVEIDNTAAPDVVGVSEIEENIIKENTTEENFEVEIEQLPEVEDDETEVVPEIWVVRDFAANFTSRWAKTPTHFFLAHNYWAYEDGRHTHYPALYRLPLNNISQGQMIDLPDSGMIDILGMNDEYLLISHEKTGDWRRSHFVIYRLSFETLQATQIAEGVFSCVGRFHAASNSILFLYVDFDLPFEEVTSKLYSLCLDTGERHMIYELETEFLGGIFSWIQVEDDAVVFSAEFAQLGGDMVLIDSQLNATQISGITWSDSQSPRFWNQQLPYYSPAREFIYEIEAWRNGYVILGDWVYYLVSEHTVLDRPDLVRMDLWRINLDATQNTLLQEDTNIFRLYSTSNTLFGLYGRYFNVDSMRAGAVRLDGYGNVIAIFGVGSDGHNARLGFESLTGTNMVMAMQYSFFGGDAFVLGIYNPETNEYFSPRRP
jgi:hypothetical protein